MRRYTTVLGDTWDMIAYKLYGNEHLMSVLIEANPQFQEIVLFSADMVIKVPEVATAATTSLPPWKR
ncbi:tail protein X [Anaerospora sp.]|uniref:tail protein X n=1 Tax=Anaerospora sp. TaxID=1960278 RepID=UPI00289E1775|nr:tail protein X [Anaerospora sp.]